ncbi:MAG: Rieske (2Fe-2S) protein [Planctomycetota bacterium]
MADFTPVAKVGSIAEGHGETVTVDGRLVALFNRGGQYYAIDDLCPHQGASLGAGEVDEDGAVACPWHAWRFNIKTGKWCDNPTLGVDTFEVRVNGDEIQVRVAPHGA